ncbi:hypothetical protein [Micromonospora tarensis]|uniref:hypothetical protein n=1 Tax=Micromonospora tarensis TaxID=2806100 RepID=UPI001EE414B4|nr:hypothetical protein [Micromonospora tarensis]
MSLGSAPTRHSVRIFITACPNRPIASGSSAGIGSSYWSAVVDQRAMARLSSSNRSR